jgi:hypothetical protein
MSQNQYFKIMVHTSNEINVASGTQETYNISGAAFQNGYSLETA